MYLINGRCRIPNLPIGSAHVPLLTVATVRESLAGRVEIIPLYPLGMSERQRVRRPQFIGRAFRGLAPPAHKPMSDNQLLQAVASGGYLEAIKRRSEGRRHDWYRAYADSIIQRDLPEIASLSKAGSVPRVLQLAARLAGQLINLSEIGRGTGLDHKTADQYLRVLEQLYLVSADFVLEDSAGRVVGIEVKAAASVNRQDFGGLSRLATAAGDAFVQGILLYQGDEVLPFGPNLRAVPLPALWA